MLSFFHDFSTGKKSGLIIVLMAPLLLQAGCGPRPEVSTEPNVQGYQQLIEDMHSIDPSPLQGRLIMLDPGHGGFFRGARGPNGLAEADVNLGVALYLRGLLEWAGAEVVMTRTTDRDFLTPADSTLASDLAFRVSMSDSLQPDVFISLHHNSNPSRDPTINETQTYYPVGENGASLELARSIHRHLALNLQITPAKILAGNFHVLRNATVPAVLGEPAMISNPVMAGRLSLAASQRIEAEAYFLGLLDYFAQGAPAWQTALGDTLPLPATGPLPVLSWTFTPDHRHRGPSPLKSNLPGPDLNTFQVTFNGRLQTIVISPEGSTVSWAPTKHTQGGRVSISGRNLSGRSTPAWSTTLVPAIVLPPHVTIFQEAAGDQVLISWQWPPYTNRDSGTIFWPQGPAIQTQDHPEQAVLITLPASVDRNKPPLWQALDSSQSFACNFEKQIIPAPWQWHHLEGLPISSSPTTQPWRYRLGAPPTGLCTQEIPAAFLAINSNSMVWIEKAGLLPILAGTSGADSMGMAYTLGATTWSTTQISPATWGKVIVLDPRGGGSETDGQGPLGTRGADLNLRVAQLVAEYLRGAGATVLITRADGHHLDNQDKVLLAKNANADLFLVIGRHNNPKEPRLRHYPGSSGGTLWAQTTATFWAQLDSTATPISIGPGADYLLRHTHCPALVMELPSLNSAAQEFLLNNPGHLRSEASAIAMGIMGQLAGQGAQFPVTTLQEVLASVPGTPPLAQVSSAIWDGNFVISGTDMAGNNTGTNDGDSVVSWQALWPAKGPWHQLEIHLGNTWQVWHLALANNRWQGRMVLAGP